jgi:hypothetical protein
MVVSAYYVVVSTTLGCFHMDLYFLKKRFGLQFCEDFCFVLWSCEEFIFALKILLCNAVPYKPALCQAWPLGLSFFLFVIWLVMVHRLNLIRLTLVCESTLSDLSSFYFVLQQSNTAVSPSDLMEMGVTSDSKKYWLLINLLFVSKFDTKFEFDVMQNKHLIKWDVHSWYILWILTIIFTLIIVKIRIIKHFI